MIACWGRVQSQHMPVQPRQSAQLRHASAGGRQPQGDQLNTGHLTPLSQTTQCAPKQNCAVHPAPSRQRGRERRHPMNPMKGLRLCEASSSVVPGRNRLVFSENALCTPADQLILCEHAGAAAVSHRHHSVLRSGTAGGGSQTTCALMHLLRTRFQCQSSATAPPSTSNCDEAARCDEAPVPPCAGVHFGHPGYVWISFFTDWTFCLFGFTGVIGTVVTAQRWLRDRSVRRGGGPSVPAGAVAPAPAAALQPHGQQMERKPKDSKRIQTKRPSRVRHLQCESLPVPQLGYCECPSNAPHLCSKTTNVKIDKSI